MVDANAANQEPGRNLITTDQLFADLMQPGNMPPEHRLHVEELSIALGSMVAPRPHFVGTGSNREAEQVRRSTQGYGPRLQIVLDATLSEPNPSEGLALWDQLERVLEFDSLVRAAAGQPVVVMKPGKTWLDVGFLERPQHTYNNTGLQVADSLPDITSPTQLPVRGTVTIDLRTGDAPKWDDQQQDDELRLRNTRHTQDASPEQPVRPDINPLHAHLILGPEDAEGIEANSKTAYVLVGYPFLQQTLNRVLGFDLSKVDMNEASSKFNTAVQTQQRLVQAGVKFLDIDFIDGCLAYQIELLEQEMAEAGPLREVSMPYQDFLLERLQQKYTSLVENQWISSTPTA